MTEARKAEQQREAQDRHLDEMLFLGEGPFTSHGIFGLLVAPTARDVSQTRQARRFIERRFGPGPERPLHHR